MSWGISENASEKEKLKAEVNDYFYGLNAVGKIDYIGYSTLYDACMPILEECYDRMKKEREAESEDEDVEYQRQIEQLEHDILYEPTFNSEDGSM